MSITASTPCSEPSRRRTTGIPPPPLHTDEHAGRQGVGDRGSLHDLDRLRRRHHAPPAAAGVFAHDEPLLDGELPGTRLGVEGPDRLGRRGEGGIALVDHALGQKRGDRRPQAQLDHVVVEALLQHVADLPLGLGAADVHGHGRDELGREVVLDQDVADLGTVAVGEHDAPAVGHEARDAPAALVDVDELLLEGADLAGLQDGVAAQGDDHGAGRLRSRRPSFGSTGRFPARGARHFI